jgi:hypothetical protein
VNLDVIIKKAFKKNGCLRAGGIMQQKSLLSRERNAVLQHAMSTNRLSSVHPSSHQYALLSTLLKPVDSYSKLQTG